MKVSHKVNLKLSSLVHLLHWIVITAEVLSFYLFAYYNWISKFVRYYNWIDFFQKSTYRKFLCRNKFEKVILADALTETWWGIKLKLSWWGSLSHRNQSTDWKSKSINWFLYHRNLRHGRVKSIDLFSSNYEHFLSMGDFIVGLDGTIMKHFAIYVILDV